MHKNLDLFLTMAKISATCFGGGYAIIPLLQRELVENKGWIRSEDLTDMFSISQCTPGVISVNAATFVGTRLGGFSGALCATLGGNHSSHRHYLFGGSLSLALPLQSLGAACIGRPASLCLRSDFTFGGATVSQWRSKYPKFLSLSGCGPPFLFHQRLSYLSGHWSLAVRTLALSAAGR